MAAFLEAHREKWVPEPNTGCWLWTAALINSGRPVVGVGPKSVKLVSRVVCEERHGPPPTPKHYAAHATPNGCVGGLCVNPSHLRWATSHENHMDIPPEQRSDRTRRGWLKNKQPRNVCKQRQEAIAAGAAIYVTSKPCRRGHVGPKRVVGGCIECANERNAMRYIR